MGRFAPSTTGPAHPGTLLSALLAWLDARSRAAQVALRLEDLDPQRCRPEWSTAMLEALDWFGLDWDRTQVQSERDEAYAAALDELASAGRLYPCSCSRSEIRADGRRAPDGGWRYANRCRDCALPDALAGGWRSSDAPLRVRLDDATLSPSDASAVAAFGDPVVRRRDGATAYHLATVVDDGHLGVTHVVRGRDLEASTAIQMALQQLLGLPTPHYRHHFLLLEERGEKLAKLHGAVGFDELRRHYTARELCGVLAGLANLQPGFAAVTPAQLLVDFDWERVSPSDRTVRWTGDRLTGDRG